MAAKKKSTKKKAPRKKAPAKAAAKKAPRKKAPAKKAPSRKKAPTKKAPPKATAKPAPAAGSTLHGVQILGDAKKGGTSKFAATAQLSLGQIRVVKGLNPRTDIGDIEHLSASIAAEGLLSSLVVRPSKVAGKFDLIAGERRYRAMEKIGYKADIPVVIRTDLDDDARARAVAIAENSPDGRTDLNPIEIGRVVVELAEQDWTVSRIAKETGLHQQKVRRSLTLMEQPKDIQKRVESGAMSMVAGLEYAKLDDKTRKSVSAALEDGQTASAADIRRLRKEADTKAKIEGAAKPDDPKKSGKDKPSKRVAVAWRGSREKQELLQAVCYDLVSMKEEGTDPADYDFIETRAVAMTLFWDRGDLTELEVPGEDATETKDKKALAVFWKVIEQEAAKHEPEDDDEDEAEAA